jgi:putative hydrolase of the HAD superfamily
MRAAGWEAFRRVEVTRPMRGYGDLDLLPELGDARFLVTSGFRRLQESKVRALGIASHFTAIVVDAVDEPDRLGKERIFTDLITRFRLNPEDVLVVGDNVESELAAARRLGIRSVQTLRPGVIAAQDVTAHVRDLRDLRAWLLTEV